MSWRLDYYVMVALGRQGLSLHFLSRSGVSLGIGEGGGKHFPREFPESGGKERAVPEEGRPGRAELVGGVPGRGVDQGLLGMRRMTACLSSPENLKGIFWA